MRLKSIYKSVFLTTVVLFAGCSGDEFSRPAGSSREAVSVTLTVSRPGDSSTRTILDDREDGGLKSVWTADDKLLVVTADGTKAGELALKSGENSTKGIFAGTLSLSDGDKAMVWYLGASNYLGASDTESKPYASAILSGDKVTSLSIDLKSDKLRGTFHDLKRADLLVKEIAFTVKDDKGYVKGDANGNDGEVALTPLMAMAHFSLDFDEEVELTDDATLSVTADGENQLLGSAVVNTPGASSEMTVATDAAGYNLPVNSTEIFLPFVPATYTLKFVLKNGDKTYEGALAQNTLTAGLYYQEKTDGSTGNGYKGISVSLTDVTPGPLPTVDDEVVGPSFPIEVYDSEGNKVTKYVKFTRGNLYYTTSDKQWHLFDNQIAYKGVAGKGVGYDAEYTSVPVLDLFRWGATGYKDYNKEVVKPGMEKIDARTNLSGTYLPYRNAHDNGSVGSLRTIKVDKDGGITNHRYCDWGYVYGLQNHTGDIYYTLTTDEWRGLFNTYVHCTATVANVKGVIMLPYTSLDDAKNDLKDNHGIDVTYLKWLRQLPQDGITLSSVTWTLLVIDSYEKLAEINAVFFPAAGHHVCGNQSSSSNLCNYWTATEYNTNAHFFMVRNLATGSSNYGFNIGQTGGQGKAFGASVRLVKVIDSPDDSEVTGK